MPQCRFCQAHLEPGIQRCRQCGQLQSEPVTDPSTGPRATTPLLPPPASAQVKLLAAPAQEVRVPEKPSETRDAGETGKPPVVAATPTPAAAVEAQNRPLDPPAQEVHLPDKEATTPDTQELIQPGTPSGATETLSRLCPACQKTLPDRVHLCPACGHPTDQPAPPPEGKNNQDVPGPTTTARQESGDGAARVQTTSPAPQASPATSDTAPGPSPVAPPSPPVAEDESRTVEERVAEVKTGEDNEREAEQEGEEEEEEGPVATFRRHRIAFETLHRPFQILLLLTLAQIGVVALLLATQNLPQPMVRSGVIAAQGQIYLVPLAAFIVLVVSLIAATWFALAGALRVHWSVRMSVIALVTLSLAASPLTWLTTNADVRGEPLVTVKDVRWLQLALVALIWLGAVAVSLFRWRARRKGAVLPSASRSWHAWAFGVAGVPILLYYALELVVWRAYAAGGLPGAGLVMLLLDIGHQAYLLPSLLLLLVYWSSTDLLEWSEIIAKSLVSVMQRAPRPGLLATVTALTAVGMLLNELRLHGWSIFLTLAVTAVLIALIALVVRFARLRSDWPTEIPPLALLLGAIVLYLQFEIVSEVITPLAFAHGLEDQNIVGPLLTLLEVPILLAALTTGLVLVARGRTGKPKQGVIGLFLVMVVLLDVATDLPAIFSAADIPVGILQQPYSLFAGLKFFAAAGALVWLSALILRRQSLRAASTRIVGVFLLLAGLQAIDWLYDLANGIGTLGARSTVLLAGLFVLTTLWDLVNSGEQVTNADTPAFPREGRVLLYVASTLVATSLLLYIGSLRAQTVGTIAPDYFSTDSDAFIGLFLLGAPMVVLAFLLRVGPGIQRPAAVAAPLGRVSSRTMQLGIGGSGVLALAVFTVFLMGSILPRLVQSNQRLPEQGYETLSPGPGCADARSGAIWDIPPDLPLSLRCLPKQGTQFTAMAGKDGLVAFLAPDMWHVENYRVSLQVDFSHFPAGCVSILTRFSEAAYYENAICTDGTWELARSAGALTPLAYGHVVPARTYTLEATTNGPEQSLTINGSEKASITDGTSTTGSLQLDVFNKATSAQSVVLSNFIFTPLPRNTPTAPSSFSVPSSAALVFRDPLTSPGMWNNQPADASGRACQFVQNGYRVQVGQKDQLGDCTGGGQQDYSNFVFQVHMRIITGDCGGIGFREPERGAGYFFLVCQQGTYALFVLTRSGQSFLIAQGTSALIPPGLQADNLIAVVANGTRLDFYANQQRIYGTTDNRYSHGLMALTAVTVNSTPAQVVYWDASVWTL